MRIIIATLIVLFAVRADALEKVARPDYGIERDAGQWALGCTSRVSYYNLCTGWIWTWSGWEAQEQAAVFFQTEQCSDEYALHESWHFAETGAPAAYGYTGTMKLTTVDSNRCPAVTLASRPFLPSVGWTRVDWQEFPPPGSNGFLLVWTNGPVGGSPVSWATDHPSAGPTGPPACGNCYPVTRGTRSFRLGTSSSPLCPGTVFPDEGCNAELVWEIVGNFTAFSGPPVSTPPPQIATSSWGAIKSLYR